MTDTVLYHVENNVGYVTLNRPEKLNAIDIETHLLLKDVLLKADDDPENRVVVITGAGRGFCSGGDTGRMGGGSFGKANRRAVMSPGRHLVDTIINMEKPTIAAVNGPAVGLGATIALLCDIVVMADEARIGDRHVNVGLVAGDGGAVIWPLLIGPAKAKEFMITGRLIHGPEAERIGLIARSVPQAELMSTVHELADEIAGLPPYAVQATKASVNKILEAVSGLVLDTSLAYEHLSMKTEDHQEALRARKEKRAGVYTGN
jgi:enoyl-CoA hydratase